MLHRAANCARVLRELGFGEVRRSLGTVQLERNGAVVVLPETGAVSSGILVRLVRVSGVDASTFTRMLSATDTVAVTVPPPA